MNTEKIAMIGRDMMMVGAAAFLGGLGICGVCTGIDNHKYNKIRKREALILEEKRRDELNVAKKLEAEAVAEREKAYSFRLQNMSDKDFAKHHAECVAKANDEVIKTADRKVQDMRSELTQVKLDCTDKIAKANADCLAKVEKAQKEAEEARKRYDEIDKLFTNKNDILRAKAELERLTRREQDSKEDKDELLNKLEKML